MPAESASASATITRRRAPFNNSWTVCARWFAGRMDLLPSFTRRYVPDSTSRNAHNFLCTYRSTVSSTYSAGLEKSELGRIRGSSYLATSAAQQIRHLPCAQTVHNSGINEEKSKVLVGHDMDGEVPADIDEMKVKLLQRRRTKFQTGGDYYDESDESGENEQIDSLTEEEIEYLIALLSGGEIQEEDAELVLALMRDAGADINDYLPSLINEFPGLTKRLYYFCLDYYDKSALADAISSVMLREAQSLLNSSRVGLPKLQKIL